MTQRGKRMIGMMGITLAVYFVMKYLFPVVAPFFVAWLLARGIYPIAARISVRLSVKKEVVALVLMLAGTGLLALLCWFLGMQLCRQVRAVMKNLPHYERQIDHLAGNGCQMAEKIFGIKGEEVMEFLRQNVKNWQERVRLHVLPEMMQDSMRYLWVFLKAVGIFFLIFAATLLLIRDYEGIRGWMKKRKGYERAVGIVERLWSLGGVYVKAQLLIMLIVMGICVTGFMLLKNPYALLIGMLIGFLDAFPFIGTGTILCPWALYVFLKKDFLHAAAYVTLFVIANTTREYLEPRLIGSRMGIYPIVIAFSVYAGMWLYGAVGVILGPLSLLVILECAREFYKGGEA